LDVSKLPTYSWTEEDTGITYIYRQAAQADVLDLPYVVEENDVVIVDVKDSRTGRKTHVVPATVGDDKQVVALGQSAYKNCSHMKNIYLPENLLAFHPGAITHKLDYLYISGEYLAKGGSDYNGVVPTQTKVYCSESCQDQYGSAYSENYLWEAWTAPTYPVPATLDHSYIWRDPESGISYTYYGVHPSEWGNNDYEPTGYEIVLFAVRISEETNVCRIPSHINGYRVFAVDYIIPKYPLDEIYLPDTVVCFDARTFNNNSMANRPIHIYYPGPSLDCDPDAFYVSNPEGLYLHLNWKE